MQVIIRNNAKKHITKELSKTGKIYDNKKAIEKLENLISDNITNMPNKIIIDVYKDDTYNGNNMTFCMFYPYIKITSRYIYDYVSAENNKDIEEAEKSILACIGHELGHEKYGYFFELPITSNMKLRKKILEVFCDHYALNVVSGLSSEESIKDMEKARTINGDNEGLTHPSWTKRMEYIKEPFDENMIRKMANDYGCNSESFIKRQIRFYKKGINKNGEIKGLHKFRIISKGIALDLLGATLIVGSFFIIFF